MSTRENHHSYIIEILKELKAKYPNQGIGRHLSEALTEYPNYWGMSDKEFLFALRKYKFELEANIIPPEQEIQKLVEDSASIDKLREGIEDYEEGDYEEDLNYGDEEE